MLPTWRFPEGRLGFAVGDIHGRADLVARLFDRLEHEALRVGAADPVVVFLGDYIDRGPDSAEVIELLVNTGRPEGFERRFIVGNHERGMLAFLDDPTTGRDWIAHGGLQTLRSYGVAAPASLEADALRLTAEALRTNMPPSHQHFLRSLERYVALGDYLFVHAGVDPAKPLEDQTLADLCGVRERFLKHHGVYSHCIVHGHTPEKLPYQDNRRIGIDTGAYMTGVLTAVRLEGETSAFVEVRRVAGKSLH